MATEYSRLIHKRTAVPGLAPTVPASDNLNDFTGTDIYEGELFYNITDQKLYTRSNSEIVLLNNSSGGGLTFDIGSWNTTSPKTFAFPDEIDPNLVVSMSLVIINDDEDTWYVSGPDLWVQSFDGLSAVLRARNVPGNQTRTNMNRGKLKIQFGNAG
jgi:hypothetical protein